MTDDLESLHPTVQWIVTEARRAVPVDHSARARLLDAVKLEPRPVRVSRFRSWLAGRSVTLTPLASLAAAAGLMAFGVMLDRVINRDDRVAIGRRTGDAVVPSQLPDSLQSRMIKFVLIAPQAARVSIVGDFNNWDSSATPAERLPDGTWVTFVPLMPGRHEYSFVLDGQRFITDPTAPMGPDDGYGRKNSVVVVKGASS